MTMTGHVTMDLCLSNGNIGRNVLSKGNVVRTTYTYIRALILSLIFGGIKIALRSLFITIIILLHLILYLLFHLPLFLFLHLLLHLHTYLLLLLHNLFHFFPLTISSSPPPSLQTLYIILQTSCRCTYPHCTQH